MCYVKFVLVPEETKNCVLYVKREGQVDKENVQQLQSVLKTSKIISKFDVCVYCRTIYKKWQQWGGGGGCVLKGQENEIARIRRKWSVAV